MVQMEVIELDNTVDGSSLILEDASVSFNNSDCGSKIPSPRKKKLKSQKRKKKEELVKNTNLNEKMSALKNLIDIINDKKYKAPDVANTSSNSVPPVTNSEKENTTEDFNTEVSEDNSNVEEIRLKKLKRKRKKSSVVIIDSDDDCVIVDKSSSTENKIKIDEVKDIPNTSIIVLSDNEEDIGVVAGSLETANSWKDHKKIKSMPGNDRLLGLKKTLRLVYEKHPGLSSQISHQAKARKLNQQKSEDPICKYSKNGNSVNIRQEVSGSRNTNVIPNNNSMSYMPGESNLNIKTGLRPIVIDGSNVAFGHGKNNFSAKGIEICVNYFLQRNHREIHALVPQFRRRHNCTVGYDILDKLEKERLLVYTPSRFVEGKLVTSYDDRFIVEYASKTGGVIISRDNYKDLLQENREWGDTIKFRVLQYTFIGDMIMFPVDPLGPGGPTLDQLLSF